MNIRASLLAPALALALALASHPAAAELVSIDLDPGSGDQLLLRDTVTGFDWLDVTQTVNQTYDQVRTGVWYQLGFRHATIDQLRTLFLHAGTPDDGFDRSVTYPTETRALARLLGLTLVTPNRETTTGFVGNDFFGNLVTPSTHPVGQRFSALVGKLDYVAAIPQAGLPETGEAHFTQGHPFSDEAAPTFGSFLVRSFVWPPMDVFLHGSGAVANPATLSLDEMAPAGTTAKYRDSGSVSFNEGNPWREVGTWGATPALTTGSILALRELRVWLGLKNSDDQGTRFDLRVEVFKTDELVASGQTRCIQGITRNPNSAREVAVAFDPFAPVDFDGVNDELRVRVLARIGTNPDGTKCPGHASAVGLRLYFDATGRPAGFNAP
jgi:hypothetical protein